MSKEIITSRDIQNFLKDWEENSTTELLEEGSKEQSELIEIADARGIKLKDNKDLAGIKFIYAFADEANKNGAILPTKELLKALPSMIGKPLDLSHQRGWVIGHFLDYKWIVKEKKVIAYAVVYKSNFAEEWEELQTLFKEGKLFTSFEIWSDHSKRKVNPDGSYELYDMTIAGGAILLRDESPAFPGAKVLELAKDRMVNSNLVFASEIKDEDIIIAKADKLIKDKSAIKEEAKGEAIMEQKVITDTVITPEAKSEVAEVKLVVAETVIPAVAKEEVAPAPEAPKVEAAVEAPKEEAKVEVAPVVEAPKAEDAKTVIEEKVVKTIEDTKVDPVTKEATRVETTESVVKVTDTYKVEQPVSVAVATEVPVVEEPKVEAAAGDPVLVVLPKDMQVTEKTLEELKAQLKAYEITIAELNTKVEWYKTNAVTIANRRSELGELAKDISDVDILDDAKFSDAKVLKANKEIEKAAEVVGLKTASEDTYRTLQNEIRDKADGKIKRTR